MNLGKLGLLASSSFIVMGVIIACSSSDTGTTSGGSSGSSGSSSGSSGSSGSSSGSSGSVSQCQIAPGSYKVHYVKDATSTGQCQDIPDQTITVKESDGGTGQPDAGSACQVQQDTANCKFTTTCHNTPSGSIVVDSTSVFQINKDGTVTGSQESKTTGTPSGVADGDCKYTFTWTKQ
jgi:hypothetical protein